MANNIMAVHLLCASKRCCTARRHDACMLFSRILTSSTNTSATDVQRAGIPLVPKYKDPNAVLKTLASTVDSNSNQPSLMGRTDADPFAPNNRRKMLDFLMAQEAGRRTAEHVINQYPKLFPGRSPNPDLGPWRPNWKGLNEDSVWEYIRARKVAKAQEVYHELVSKDHKVSLETQNGLLALLAYVGSGNTPLISSSRPSEEGEETMESDDDVMVTSEKEENLSPSVSSQMSKKPRRKLVPLRALWSLENEAEKMFTSMSDKDGMTYGAMIQGLAKFGEFTRAHELFEEARKRNLQLSLATYNQLLSALLDSSQTNLWKKSQNIISHMNVGPVVQPDITTINLLLMFALETGVKAKQNSLEIMREMTHLQLKPTLTTFLRLFDCFMKNKDISILYPIVNYLEKNSTEVLQIKEYSDVDFFAYAMLGARLLRDVSLAKRLNNLANKDQWYLSIPNHRSHYLFVSSFETSIEKLYEEYQLAVPRLFVPREWIYLMMFKKCEAERRPDIALALWQSMMKNRAYVTNIDVINRLMGAFTKTFNPEDVGEYIYAVKDVWNKLTYLDLKPSPLIVSVTIKLYTLDNQLDEAWKYYDLFQKYNMKPSFLALHALLKAYYGLSDRDKVVELLEIMVSNGLFLPLTFVRDVCHKVRVSDKEKAYFLKEFEKNKPKE